ncbi:hypothetical protein PIB30_060945 [Stylosanthes scabra]|uniref:cellulase n=1 Tax=Stylosanthes scabra TaxID=79078 RepID=A0ABU6WJ25_9FABA|nr:hypothetical protein [Stylosanthes scabra]
MVVIPSSMSMSCVSRMLMLVVICCSSLIHKNAASADYGAALTKCLLFFEGQRSGKLPPNQRLNWRGDSALNDGQDAGVDLVGGYYDAGDNLKLGFPMAFTITMLSWSAIEFREKLANNNELQNAMYAIKWGTDYLMKAHTEAYTLFGEVGDPDSDHSCWQRPEDIEINLTYASTLLTHATQLFEFASRYQGLYSNSISVAQKVYSSSGYKDELAWAAAWLHRATRTQSYLDYIGDTGGARPEFSWDDKYLGVQILASKLVLEGTVQSSGTWVQLKAEAEQFICSCAQKSSKKFDKTSGGLLWFLPWNNMQYVSTATFAMSVYSKYLSANNESLNCDGTTVTPLDLTSLVRDQVAEEHPLYQ